MVFNNEVSFGPSFFPLTNKHNHLFNNYTLILPHPLSLMLPLESCMASFVTEVYWQWLCDVSATHQRCIWTVNMLCPNRISILAALSTNEWISIHQQRCLPGRELHSLIWCKKIWLYAHSMEMLCWMSVVAIYTKKERKRQEQWTK